MKIDELQEELRLEAHRNVLWPLIDAGEWDRVLQYVLAMDDQEEGIWLVWEHGLGHTDIGDWDE